MDEVREHCGVCVSHTLHDNYNFLRSLQHRGREAAAMVAIGDNRIDAIKWAGTVTRFDVVDLHKILPSNQYHTYLGHVRYATRGRKDKILEDAHPHVIGGRTEDRGSHILIHDCDMAMVHNGQVSKDYLRLEGETVLRGDCDTEALIHMYKEIGEIEFIRRIPGAYTLAIADKRKKEVIVLRDRHGIRPGVIGIKGGKYCVASEDVALTENGGEFFEDLTPGAIYYLHPTGGYRKEAIIKPEIKHCFFEWNYISNVASILDLESVRSVRVALGRKLAEEFHPEDIDYVTFLPRCPEMAAASYAEKTGIPFIPVFYKMRGERSFQGSTNIDRQQSIQGNLHLLPGTNEKLNGKTIIVIDDSMIRGTNASHARQLLNDAGAKKIYLANYTPPIGIIGADKKQRGCLFGVDMPLDDNFIARGKSLEDISQEVGMEVVYLSKNGMLDAFESMGIRRRNLCTFCIGGKLPFKNE